MKVLGRPAIARLYRVVLHRAGAAGDPPARHGRITGGVIRLGATGALALAAASTGVVVPAVRALVEETGHGSISAGLFNAAHVAGGVLGAVWGTRALRLARSTRALAVAALVASIAVTLAMAAVDSLEVRIGLRFVDGGCHLLALTALIASATAGDAALRARRAMTMGMAIVLGVAGGVGMGALVGRPEATLAIAAMLSSAALLVVATQVAAEPAPVELPRTSARGPIAPGLLAFAERFLFGTLTVSTPYLTSQARVGLVIGVFMTASVGALHFARRYALTRGPRRLAERSTLVLALALASTALVDVFASSWRALAWSTVCGAAAGSLYASALVFAARSSLIEERMRDMAAVSAAGNTGHMLGTLYAGMMLPVLPGALVIPIPSVAIVVVAMLGVWLTMPAVHPSASR